MRLHHSVLGKGGEWQQKRARSRLHALTGSPTTGLLNYTGERAHSGRVLLTMIYSKAYEASAMLLTLETCGSISEVASFSSSLKLYMFSGYLFTIKFSIFLDTLIVSKIHSLVLIFFPLSYHPFPVPARLSGGVM